MRLPALRLHQGSTRAPGRVLRQARGSIKSAFARAFFHTFFHAFFRVFSRVFARMFSRMFSSTLLAAAALCVAACGATPAEPVPFKAVSTDRIVKPGYTEPAA